MSFASRQFLCELGWILSSGIPYIMYILIKTINEIETNTYVTQQGLVVRIVVCVVVVRRSTDSLLQHPMW